MLVRSPLCCCSVLLPASVLPRARFNFVSLLCRSRSSVSGSLSPPVFISANSACEAIKKQEAIGAKEHPGLRGRLQGYASRGPPGAELWLFELLYLHNASAANSMPEAWHEVSFTLLL